MDIVEHGVHLFNDDEKAYITPEKDVCDKLARWQDLKLGFMVHFGVYSQWGIVESWALSDDDAEWSRADVPFLGDSLKEKYARLNTTFDPVMFDPGSWAEAAADGGFRYFIFTTKHHDGFAMYDTKFSDYKITSANCPYSNNPNADISRVLFDSFREKGLSVGVYFSKPDWNSPFYWEPGKPGRYPSRGPTYSPLEDPGKWEKFKQFTHNQINELMSDYGPVDVLWLDGGWVNPASGQDIDMKQIAENARKKQPGLIVVDRTVGGPYENYVTPEQLVPKTPILIPWESNITMGTSFSYKFDDEYKSERELIHLLIDVVAKGGNLVLNAGAQPDGSLPKPALARMKALGTWLQRFGEGIYNTRACAPYRVGSLGFAKNGDRTFVFKMLAENEPVKELFVPYAKPVASVTMLGRGCPLRYTHHNNTICIDIPPLEPEEQIAFAVVIE